MYPVDRIIAPVGDIKHTHDMYHMDRCIQKLIPPATPDDVTQNVLSRLNALDESTSHLIDLVGKISKCDKNSASAHQNDCDKKHSCGTLNQRSDQSGMYQVNRLIAPISNIQHNDAMYRADKLVEDEETRHLKSRLNQLDQSVSYLLGLAARGLKSGSMINKTEFKTAIKPVVESKTSMVQSTPSPQLSIAIQANPSTPPLSALLYSYSLFVAGYPVSLHTYIHSTMQHESFPARLSKLFSKFRPNFHRPTSIPIRIVWSSRYLDCVTLLNTKSTLLYGELMLLQRLLALVPQLQLDVEEQRELLWSIDSLRTNEDKTTPSVILSKLGESTHLLQLDRTCPSPSDCLLYILVKQNKLSKCIPQSLKPWLAFCAKQTSFKLFDLLFD